MLRTQNSPLHHSSQRKLADILRGLGVQDSSNKLASDQSHEDQETVSEAGVLDTVTAWQSIMHVCKQTGSYYAFDIPATCNIEDIASALSSRHKTIENDTTLSADERKSTTAEAIGGSYA